MDVETRCRLAPSLTSQGRHDLRKMVRLMELPLRSLTKGRRSAKPVWRCVVRNHPDDPYLSDEQWATIAEQVVDAIRLGETR